MRFKLVVIIVFLFFSYILLEASVEFERKEIVFVSSQADGHRVAISVEVAATDAQKMQGFMERKNIPEGTGMIFLYDVDTKMRFWMKNTPSPLSIAFISSSGVITEIKELTPYSLETVTSVFSARYALEVPQGMFARVRLSVGDSLTKESLLSLKRLASRKS